MLWYEFVGNVLLFLSLPVVKLFQLILLILRLVLSPFIYLGQLVLRFSMIPIKIVAKLEPLWYYLAGAVLVGVVSALVLHLIFRTFVFVLRLNQKPTPKVSDTPARGHDIQTYRKARERKKRQAEKEQQEIEATAQALATSPLIKEALKQMRRDSPDERAASPGSRIRGRESLYDQTILEHTEEEDS